MALWWRSGEAPVSQTSHINVAVQPDTGDDSDGDDGPSTSGKEATVGMRTSHIKNKLVRSEMYAKLKSKDKVRRMVWRERKGRKEREGDIAVPAYMGSLAGGCTVRKDRMPKQYLAKQAT
eukprot:1159958-Pelagomonas_calceolata.AAC.8